MAVAFSPRLAFHGFDRSVSPKWQMVPVNGSRVLTLAGARGLVARVRDPTVLEAVQTTSGGTTTLTLTGKAAGLTFVEWAATPTDPGPILVGFTLEVSVKEEITINTAFHYVDDGLKQVTRRKIDDLNDMILAANDILGPQANIRIERKSAATLHAVEDFGRVVRFSSHLTEAPHSVPIAQHEWDDLAAYGDDDADFNVFFVREYESDTTPRVDNVEAGTLADEKMCVFEDRIGFKAAEVLAHETMHLLTVSDHSRNRRHLIAGANRTGRLITRDQANIINKSGT